MPMKFGMGRYVKGMIRLGTRLRGDEAGSTALEWVLLLAAVVLGGYVLIRVSLSLLVAHYQMITMLNGLPIP